MCQHIQPFSIMESMNVMSTTLTVFDFDNSYTQIVIYATKLLLTNFKQWNLKLWLEDHSSHILSQFVISVQPRLIWQNMTFSRKNEVHVTMNSHVGKTLYLSARHVHCSNVGKSLTPYCGEIWWISRLLLRVWLKGLGWKSQLFILGE